MPKKTTNTLSDLKQFVVEAQKLVSKRDALAAEASALGFKSIEAVETFLAAFGEAPAPTAPKAVRAPRVRKQGRTTPEEKQQAIDLLKEGHSAAKVAKTIGKSIATINNIKKEAGLVKSKQVSRSVTKKVAKKATGKRAAKKAVA